MSHKFYVVRKLKRNVILGLDWLKSRGVHVYHDFSCIRVQETYILLVDDIHIAYLYSIARLKTKVKLSPQTAHICQCKVRKHTTFLPERDYEVPPFKNRSLGNEPGLLKTNSVAKLSKNRVVPLLLINSTNKTLSIKPGKRLLLVSAQLVSLKLLLRVK